MAAKIEYKIFSSEIKESDETALTVTHFISTESKDRGGDIMRVSGMKLNGKPVVLLQHGRDQRVGREPIAKNLSLQPGMFKDRPGIIAKTQFYPDELGKRLWKKNVEGYMPNWSIGYVPIKSNDLDTHGFEREITEWDLVEYSLVAVPMQADAQTLDGDSIPELKFKIMLEGEPEADNVQKPRHSPDEGTKGQGEGQQAKADEPAPDPLAVILQKLQGLEDTVKDMEAKVKQAAPSLPASPDAGAKSDEGQGDNPPEKVIPRLKIVDSSQAKADQRELVKSIVADVLKERACVQFDKLMGKVP